MPKSIGNRSPEAIIEAIEENMVEASVSLGRTEEGVVFRGADVTWVYTGYPALSRVLRARFTHDEAEDRIAEISECFRQWDAPVLWVVGPSSWPPNLPELLSGSGFGSSEFWTGMAVDLNAVPKTLPTAAIGRIEAVAEKEAMQTWATVTNESWAGEGDDTAVEIFAPENAGGDPRCRYYLAYQNDKPVARAMSYTRGEIVGLYWIAAAKECRDVGFEAAIAQRALADAQNSGARIGVMPSHDGIGTLAATLKFTPYCQFKVYSWPPAPLRMSVS
jgi:hypothetical protein